MKTVFFFCCRPSTSWQVPRAIGAFYHVWKWHNVQRARSEMHRCTTHAPYRSKLRQQDHCQHPQNANLDYHEQQGRAQGDENKVSGYGYGLWCGFKSGPHHATSHLQSRLKSQHQKYLDVLKSVVIPWCNQVAGDRSWVWQQDLALAHTSKETQAWLQKECYDFVPFSHWHLFLPTPEPAGLLCLVIHREHHQHDLSQHQSQPDHQYSLSFHQRLWKRHAPSSGSVSRRWLRLKAATLNRCQLYYIIKLPELIFSIKVLK